MISRPPMDSSDANVASLCADVCGQEVARLYFARALEGGRLSHAYLLVGPSGIGKARFAVALAATLLCQRCQGLAPCGGCGSCRTLSTGNHPAFRRIEAASGKRIEIDRIRETVEELAIRTESRRVVLIDGADRLSLAASNALLKTLEEPPPGAVFLLVSSRPTHLLPTIHSRCHRVPFLPLDEAELDRALAQHGLSGQDPQFCRACGGSPGTAVRLLAGIEECGGEARFLELLDGVGAERPEGLADYLELRPKESKRQRVRRLLELILDGLRGYAAHRSAAEPDPDLRESQAQQALAVAGLLRDLDGNQNAELILEDLALTLKKITT